MSENIVNKIQFFFEYYDRNSPLLAFKTQTDIRFMRELPDETLQNIYIEFLFRDFLYIFDSFLTIKFGDGITVSKDDYQYR